ncbi:putative ATPase [Cylindrospermum stagnale PCC 7417]|uniref:histidine kinase n=1 Tax=Cylindrospermum stagnale PCC 7417 TaxID=56107 RepID=K9WV44_9NOST|nr:ATP-binding sensor histidine kinase [Cylindrospermum stagnale]AFZ24260.1 putative ATPase [Cylindrospermum stagnale PCC 7417]
MIKTTVSAIALPGYRIIEAIHASARTTVYRAHQKKTQTPVIIKILSTQYPKFNDLILFRNQYAIAQNIDHPNIIKCYSLEPYGNSYALILEDFGGISLSQYANSQVLNLEDFLVIAIAITHALEFLYHNKIIHKDIKPKNILINPETKQVKIIDFSISSLLPKENTEITNPNSLSGTLAYMSPEQTGRMNRGIDYRTDFYSLGVTFYELLTGQLPFNSTNPLELVHCHLAKEPINPRVVNPKLPQAIADIITKLMAKTAEKRYQTARGIRYDLEICQQPLLSQGKIEAFELAQRDQSNRFLIPEKLYGRQSEVATLLSAFDRVSCGQIELILIAGFSGIGKTAVVNEVHKPIVRQKGYFISGKYDQLQRDIPFFAFVQAFRSLMGQLLTESTDQLLDWKNKILSALGEQGKVIIDVIPELEKIIGKQPEVAEITGIASQNRFNLIFGKFIQVLARKDHPLVIFLDDLQWADSASLKLIQLLMSEVNTQYLLLIGAYRDNEVSPGHPFMMVLDDIRKVHATVNQITLNPLNELNLNHLIADTLSCSESRAIPLTKLVLNKTKGNPFFTNQLLKLLYENGLINFDFEAGYWQYNLPEIQDLYPNNDVVKLLSLQLQKLPKTTQNILKIAACIGNQFDLYTLSIVSEQSQAKTASHLWKALQEGLILPTNEVYKLFQGESALNNDENLIKDNRHLTVYYKFLHDRVQQAAYALIPATEIKATHLKIGQIILKNTNPAELEENIFEVVNQLNIGTDLITSQSEKYELAKLNLMAGQKAKSATAYEAAIRYLHVGLALLAADSWQHAYDLTLDLYVETVEAEYLNANFEKSKELANLTLQQAKTILHQARLYKIQIQAYIAQNRHQEAVEIGVQALKNLGNPLPNKPTMLHIFAAVVQTKMTLFGKRIEDLATLPTMTDPYKLAAIQFLGTLVSTASQAGSLYFPLAILAMVKLSIKHGNSEVAAMGYSFYGAMLCDKFEDIEKGYQFGLLGLELLDKISANSLKCKVSFVFNSMIRHFKEPVKTTIIPLVEGLQSGLESGDIEYASYTNLDLAIHLFLSGENLEVLERKVLNFVELTQSLKMDAIALTISAIRQSILNCQGKSSEKFALVGEAFNELEMMPILQNNASLLNYIYFLKGLLNYHFQCFEGAIKMSLFVQQHQESDPGFLIYSVNNYYHSLALLAQFNHASPSERKQYLKQVAQNQNKMKIWAEHAPCNYKHKYELVAAEKARVLGHNWQAMELYDQAILGAKENEYIQEEALANELAAKFYLACGKAKIAQTYLIEAYYGYASWGAKAKVENLENSYPQLLATIINQKTISITQSNITDITTNLIAESSSTGISAMLDLETVTKASLAISSEVQVDKLLHTLMQVILENVGAEKASLILEQEGNLILAVQSQTHQQHELQSTPIINSQNLPVSIINYVSHTREYLLINDATTETNFAADPYIIQYQPKSILCTPILNQGKLLGILYLENTLIVGAFTSERLKILELISSQAAISLENARLYGNLEEKVLERTQELNEQNLRLQETLRELKLTQSQLIQTEKMSSIGQMVAGVAHEINNPISFIHGNLTHINEYTQNLFTLINLYQKIYPNTAPEIDEFLANIDLDFMIEDIPKSLSSMKIGTQRIRELVLTLRNFSRLDESGIKPVNIHEGIDSTLLILQSRLQTKAKHSGIEIIKNYGDLPLVECYAGQLNQVFMNILINSIESLDNFNQQRTKAEINNHPSRIIISTQVVNSDWVAISIKDNGLGISASVKQRLFDPFFTTKEVGQGVGLGLSISYQIVVDKHHGKIECISEPGKGAELVIEIPIRHSPVTKVS